MGKIFCVMGKSASGKDTIYNKILQDDSLMLSRIIPYTTRPIRDGETQDKDYHFCNEEDVKRLSAQGRIIELREYNTVYGVWKYFTVNDDDIDLRCKSYLTVGTLESYTKIRDYFGRSFISSFTQVSPPTPESKTPMAALFIINLRLIKCQLDKLIFLLCRGHSLVLHKLPSPVANAPA
jgi:guanylate kinase